MTVPEFVRERAAAVRLVVFDFDGVFTDNTVFVSQDGVEMVRCWRGDGLGLQRLAANGVGSLILSTEANPVVAVRAAKLKTRCVHSVSDKVAELERVIADAGLEWTDVGYLGNDINDLDCLRRVGLPMVVADAHPDVRAAAQYVTAAPGGHGAVREVCDLIVTVQAPAAASR